LAQPRMIWASRPCLHRGTKIVQKPGHPEELLDEGDRQAVHARCVRSLVTRDPFKRHQQRRRVVHEVEQVVEPAANQDRPPPNGEVWPASSIPAGAALRATRAGHRYSPAPLSALQPPSLLVTAAVLPHVPGFPRLGVLRRLRPAPIRSADDVPSPSPHWLGGVRAGSRRFPCSL